MPYRIRIKVKKVAFLQATNFLKVGLVFSMSSPQ